MEMTQEKLNQFESIILERFQVAARRALVDTELVGMDDIELVTWYDNILRELVVYIRAYLTSEKLAEIHVKYPQDWWQAFKEYWFPKWLLRKFPVQYHEEHYDVRAFYPKISLPREKHYVRIIRTDK